MPLETAALSFSKMGVSSEIKRERKREIVGEGKSYNPLLTHEELRENLRGKSQKVLDDF